MGSNSGGGGGGAASWKHSKLLTKKDATGRESVDGSGWGGGGSHGEGAGGNGHVRITVVSTGKVHAFDNNANFSQD